MHDEIMISRQFVLKFVRIRKFEKTNDSCIFIELHNTKRSKLEENQVFSLGFRIAKVFAKTKKEHCNACRVSTAISSSLSALQLFYLENTK